MKTISLRALAREAPGLEEITLVTHDGSVIGQYFPLDKVQSATAAALVRPRLPSVEDTSFREFHPAQKPGSKK